MKRISILLTASLAAVAAACSVDEVSPEINSIVEEDQVIQEQEAESCLQQGVVIVKFTDEMAALVAEDIQSGSVMTKSSELNTLVSTYGITSISRVFADDERWLERQHREGLDRWYEITFDPETAVATKAADDFGLISGVEVAEVSPIAKPTYYYNDTYYPNQWHLCGTYAINVEEVWDKYTKGSPDVIVAVVDGGIDQTHPDLSDNLIAGGVGGSKNFYSNSYVIYGHGHGTHVGGIISAVTNNGKGVAGIAGGDYAAGIAGTKLLSCQVFYESGGNDYSASTSRFAEAIQYGADNGALICQNSWGYSYSTESQAKAGTTPTVIQTAIDYFIKYAGCDNSGNQLEGSLMQGGIVTFAAGNDGWQYANPASYDPVIAVGATDSSGSRAYYSNYGDWVDICAPGSGIYSTYYSNGSAYASASGTSMACPMVSGVAALVIAYQGGPGFTNTQLEECLVEGADPDRITAANVGPYLDALGAVLYGIETPPDPIESFDVSVAANNVSLTWQVPSACLDDESEPAYGATIFASKTKSSIENLVPKQPGSDVETFEVQTDECKIGDSVTATVSLDSFSTTYYVTVVPFNFGYMYAQTHTTKTVATGVNNPPEITPDQDVDDLTVRASRSVQIAFEIADPDGHELTIDYKAGSAAEKWAKSGDTSYTLTINGSAMNSGGGYVDIGSYTSTITATDAYGASTACKVHYTLLENQAPEVTGTMDNQLLILGDASTRMVVLDLDECFADPDEDALIFTVANSSSHTVQAVVSVTSEEGSDGNLVTMNKLYLTGMNSGTSTISVLASDPRGLSCSQTITVPVREEGETVVAYPNPVSDILYVGTEAAEASTNIRVASSTGSNVYDNTSVVSAFKPASIDFSKFAPGSYSVIVSYGSNEVTKKVVKK